MNSKVILLFILMFGIGCISFSRPRIQLPSQTSELRISPPKELKRFTLGYNENWADVLWLRLIQDFDYCENLATEKSSNNEDTLPGILGHKMKPSRCHKGWVFHMLDAITDLAPKFKMPYSTGGPMLAIGVDDREGARIIFEKGIRVFPKDWRLLYAASYLYIYEIQDQERAAELLVRAYNNGGPSWLPILASRLFDSVGRSQLGVLVLRDFIEQHRDEPVAERAKLRLAEIERQLENQKHE